VKLSATLAKDKASARNDSRSTGTHPLYVILPGPYRLMGRNASRTLAAINRNAEYELSISNADMTHSPVS